MAGIGVVAGTHPILFGSVYGVPSGARCQSVGDTAAAAKFDGAPREAAADERRAEPGGTDSVAGRGSTPGGPNPGFSGGGYSLGDTGNIGRPQGQAGSPGDPSGRSRAG